MKFSIYFSGDKLSCNTSFWISLLFFFYFTTSVSAQWIQQGPGPSINGQVEGILDGEVVGAVNCVTPHPGNADILYIGAANGGIWRTEDATSMNPSWAFISPGLPSQSIGALEFDPADASNQTLVVGLGRTSSFLGVGVGPRGVFRTTTGTAPWTNIDLSGTFTNRDITGIAAQGSTIVVSTSSGGIFRTTNTGTNWNQISGAVGTGLPIGNSFDLVRDPSNPNTLYTNAGSNGIYRSTNMGADWTIVSDAAVDASMTSLTNLELAVGNSNQVFAVIVTGGQLSSVYRSANGASPWTSLDIPLTTEGGVNFGIHVGGQGSLHLSLVADPTNANVVYVGGDRQPGVDEGNPALPRWPNSIGAQNYTGRLFRIDASQPSGSQANPITHVGTSSNSAPHADSRDMDFDANGDLIEGDDGGVYKQSSPINASGDWTSLNGDINVSEIHSSDWDAVSNIIISGLQDNGAPQQVFPTNSQWNTILQGDGGDVAVDDISSTTTSTRYLSAQLLGNFLRMVYSSGNVLQSWTFPGLINTATGLRIGGFSFVNPIKINSQNGQRILISTNGGLFESFDQGNTVTLIPGLTAGVNGFGVDALAYGASDNANIIYAGSGGNVLVRTTAAGSLNNLTAYTGGFVRGVTIDPDDSQSAYVIDNNNVFETTNTGGAWQTITGNLATFNPGRLRAIAYIPNSGNDILAVGADQGVFIAPGPDFDTWARLGTNLPLAAVYDLEYDNVDDILLATTMGRGAWTWNFSERDPVDLLIVLDISGSMLSQACPTCDPKLDVLKESVEIFLQLWKGLAVEDDRIGIVYFRTNVDAYEDGGEVLLSAIEEIDILIKDIVGQNTTGSQLTAMGGGLQFAINELTDASRPRNIILFTDGMQNVNPGVVFPGLTIEDGVFSINSNVNATPVATELDLDLDIKVNTIGVGATSSFESQLADIAKGTDGVSKITIAPDEDLRQFFVEELVDVLRDFSPQLVGYRKGSFSNTRSEAFSINPSAKEVVFKVSYKTQDEVAVSILNRGQDVTQFAEITRGRFYQIFSFPFERLLLLNDGSFDGSWEVQMQTGQNPINYEIAVVVDEPSIDYVLSIEEGPFKVGDAIKLRAEILVDSFPITENITVTATLDRPRLGLGTVLSTSVISNAQSFNFEPNNITLGAQKLFQIQQNPNLINRLQTERSTINFSTSSDQAFEAVVPNVTIPGTYTVTFTINGEHPSGGVLERTEKRSIIVRFSQFDLDASNVLVNRQALGESTIWTWTFTPRDIHGNYLGPDYGNLLQISSENGNIQNLKDLGDGTYVFEIRTGSNQRPTVRVGLYDEVWFDGLIPDETSSRFKWSVHAGATIPGTNMNPLFDPSFYGKLDLEYIIRPNLSIQLTGGLYDFKSDLSAGFGSLQGKGYLKISPKARFFGEAGLGVFGLFGDLGVTGTYLGLDLGAGFDFELSKKTRLSLQSNFINLFDHPDNYNWYGIGLGIHIGL